MAQMKNVCFTSFNMEVDWFDRDYSLLDKKNNIKYMVIQGELTKDGKKHIQGFIQFHNKKRMDFIKKLLTDNTLHIEPMRGTPEQARKYCTDEYTDENGENKELFHSHYEYGVIDLTTHGQRTDLIGLKNKILEGESVNSILRNSEDNKEIHNILQYGKTLRTLEQIIQQEKVKEDLISEYKDVKWKDWQQDILNIIDKEPDGRTINWIWEPTGKVGKSYLGDYIVSQYGGFHITGGKKQDILYAYGGEEIIVIDLPRDETEGKEQQKYIYNVIETLLGRVYLNTKYESKMMYKPKTHIIIFANNEPDTKQLSEDRWNIIKLDLPEPSNISKAPAFRKYLKQKYNAIYDNSTDDEEYLSDSSQNHA